jgi:hypothetical protein
MRWPESGNVFRVWTRRGMQAVYLWVLACVQARSCVLPHNAAVHSPRARGSTRGPSRRGALEALRNTLVFPTRLIDRLPLPLIDLLTSPTTPNPDNALPGGRARRSIGPSLCH